MSQSQLGPLGAIRGMTFDPTRNRYFPTPKDAPPEAARPIARPPPRAGNGGAGLPLTGCDPSRGNKRMKTGHLCRSEPIARPRTGRIAWTGRSAVDVNRVLQRHYSDLSLRSAFLCGGCHGEQITFLKSFAGGAFYAGTDHGKVVIHRQNGETHGVPVCATGLTWMHCDIPRMTMLAIAGGPEAHLHHFWRDPSNLEHFFMQHSELNLPQGDVFSSASFDDVCTLGGSKSLTSVHYSTKLSTTRRTLYSDVLAVDQAEPHLVFCGFRNGSVGLEDLRLQPGRWTNRVGGTMKQKAVVGVKRLSDGAVPWGLVVSGLGDELLLFDIRFSKEPLQNFNGHINNYHTRLGLATSPDDKFLWAAGSDCRVRLYSTISGERVMPANLPGSGTGETSIPDDMLGKQIGPKEENPLRRVFKGRVENICVRPDDWGVDLSVKGEMMRFSGGADSLRQAESGDEESGSESEDEGRGARYTLDEVD